VKNIDKKVNNEIRESSDESEKQQRSGAMITATNKKFNEKIATNDKKKKLQEQLEESSENSYEKKRASTATKKAMKENNDKIQREEQ